jgi:hypothetical protein
VATLSIDIRSLLDQQSGYLLVTSSQYRLECIAKVATLSINIRSLLD